MDRGLNQRQRHAALAAKVFGRPSYSVRQRDVNRFVGAVDHGFAKLRPHLVWRSEISDILSSKISVRLQMVWDNLSCLGTEALARLG